MDIEADGDRQILQRRQTLTAGLGSFPVVGGHLEQGVDVLLPQHPDAVLHMADLGVGEAFVGSLLHLVGIGVVIEHLL